MQWKFRSQITVVLSVLTIALALMPGAWPASSTQAADAGKITVTVLYSFGENGPQYPQDFIAQGRDGNLYSTTPYGGTSNDGTVYKITPAGNLSVLYDFSSYNGSSGLTLGTDGNFYGTTIYGGGGNGYGTVFSITPSGKMKVLAMFSGQNFDAYPAAPPIQASDGNFYGTDLGSAYGTGSTVYGMTPSGRKFTLFRFDHHKQGSNLADPLVQGTDGNFYGTTNVGGNSSNCGHWGCGVVFKLTPTGRLRVLHNFSVGDGAYPTAPLVEGSDGGFYGTVPQGGYGYDYGVVFKITSGGKFTLLHIFTGDGDGIAPNAALVEATDGNFYGTTFGGGTAGSGTIYKISPDGTYSVIYSFEGAAAPPRYSRAAHQRKTVWEHTGISNQLRDTLQCRSRLGTVCQPRFHDGQSREVHRHSRPRLHGHNKRCFQWHIRKVLSRFGHLLDRNGSQRREHGVCDRRNS
jgi:uncharacterized repeat protein (TIGR03803 family)